MPDKHIQREAEGWDLSSWDVSAQKIAIVYSYMKNKYELSQTLEDIERISGIPSEGISLSLRVLEEHGYVAISRSNKPLQYAVLK